MFIRIYLVVTLATSKMNTMSIARRVITSIKTQVSSKKVYNLSVSCNRNFSVSTIKNMKLVQFVYNEKPNEIRAGYLEGDNVVDINKADSNLPSTMIEILKNGDIEKVKK